MAGGNGVSSTAAAAHRQRWRMAASLAAWRQFGVIGGSPAVGRASSAAVAAAAAQWWQRAVRHQRNGCGGSRRRGSRLTTTSSPLPPPPSLCWRRMGGGLARGGAIHRRGRHRPPPPTPSRGSSCSCSHFRSSLCTDDCDNDGERTDDNDGNQRRTLVHSGEHHNSWRDYLCQCCELIVPDVMDCGIAPGGGFVTFLRTRFKSSLI